ncbi:MAG: transcriptional regulator NrdR [Candidatus Moranbacteria bacterium RBG_13_45_13]|nr:MAG: transcriptional regulator NrdR [Candidatus Moranbacteria bacterium RBG_13_45_13]
MVCPFCAHLETKVIDSREASEGKVIRRRRECLKCQKRFSTYEQLELLNFVVVKKDGRKEEYKRDKLENGIRKALEKRPVEDRKIEEVVDEIEYKLHLKKDCEVQSRDIGRLVLEKLKELDDVAYLRFASVYKGFGSAETFVREAEKLTQNQE